MKFIFYENEHYINDDECEECWNEPSRCKNCGGLIHKEYVDESYDDVQLAYACDKCGDRYEFE